jgi:hypothetical protein
MVHIFPGEMGATTITGEVGYHADSWYSNRTSTQWSKVSKGSWSLVQMEFTIDRTTNSQGGYNHEWNICCDSATGGACVFKIGALSVVNDMGRHHHADFHPALHNGVDPDDSTNTTALSVARGNETAEATLPTIANDYTFFMGWHPLSGWAEFTDRTMPQTLTSITHVEGVAYVTLSKHNLQDGDVVTIEGATGDDAEIYNGTFTVTNRAADTFRYTMASIPAGDATGTLLATKTWPGSDIALFTLSDGESNLEVRWNRLTRCITATDLTTSVSTAVATPFRHNETMRFAVSCDADGDWSLYVSDILNGTQAVDLSTLTAFTPTTVAIGATTGCYGHGVYLGFVLGQRAFTQTEVEAAWLQPDPDATLGIVDIGAGDYPEAEAFVPEFPAVSEVYDAVAYAEGLLEGTATTATQQLAADVAAVEAEKDKILSGNTILGVEGEAPASGSTGLGMGSGVTGGGKS